MIRARRAFARQAVVVFFIGPPVVYNALQCSALQCMSLHSSSTFSFDRLASEHDRICARMKKDTQFTFRIPSDVKSDLEKIASSEGRSVAQICEVFLRAGIESYGKKGSSFLQRFLLRRKKDSPE